MSWNPFNPAPPPASEEFTRSLVDELKGALEANVQLKQTHTAESRRHGAARIFSAHYAWWRFSTMRALAAWRDTLRALANEALVNADDSL